ncbi:hypothetical protein T492DRAFT_848435 [Pavlovales sp. CCMP2436]|nr:hypothetical protein T492DRAFT_848435 [Pavlovales sp. CCMP2436]
MNSDNVGIVVFSAAIKSFTKDLQDVKIEKSINQFKDHRLLNIDQSKEYTRAFDSCMDDLTGTPGNLLPQPSPSAPNVITFIEARFWVMCGVEFDGIAAMVSYDSVEIKWDETSYVVENGIRHYAKAITGSMEIAHEFAELAANDPNLDDSRVKIRIVGNGCIEIEHPAVIQSFLLPTCLELVKDEIYCLGEEGIDYDRLLMPHFTTKNCGYVPNSFYAPSLCGLKVKVDALSTNKQTLDFKIIDDLKTMFKLRNYDLLSPLEASLGKPTIMTGAAGSGKTTLLAMEVTQMSMPDCARRNTKKGFTQTMCHARLLRETRLITEEKSRNLVKNSPANIIVDESTMLTQIGRMKFEALAAKMGSRLFFMGDYCDKTNTPMQCPPINSASMNIENLRRVHISGVKRTSDAGLNELQEELRNIRTGSAGGIYVLGGLGENAIVAARRVVEDSVPDHKHLSIYGMISVALTYAREMRPVDGNVEWKCIKSIRGTMLVNGSRFTADISKPIYNDKDMTAFIVNGIPYCPLSTIHSYQEITFENETLFIDLSYIWEVKMIYVAVSRVRRLDQIAIIKPVVPPKFHGEGGEQRLEKANQYLEEIMEKNTVIEEYPIGDGRYVADLAVFTDRKLVKLIEVVVTNPPSKEMLAYYAEFGIECKIVNVIKDDLPNVPNKKSNSNGQDKSPVQSMFMDDDEDNEDDDCDN